MNDLAVRVDRLSKVYRLGKSQQSLREVLRGFIPGAPALDAEAAGRTHRGTEFWALRDISFEVKHGDVIGIVGRNGAGKSTLLKILSRIVSPTSGKAEIHGRVASLLEVGTGFHPELTGRDNVYLNGAILGMKKGEIERKFDEIVAFAEVEQFLDTPVKRYSSGMYVRLAFAVAAHLEPDILIVDEVLAVGDSAFQNKCVGKMKDVASRDKTVLFVSHNLTAVRNLCTRAILLRKGGLLLDSSPEAVIREYLSFLNTSAEQAFRSDNPERSGTGGLRFTHGQVLDDGGRPSRHVVAGRMASFQLHYENRIGAKQAQVALTVFNDMSTAVTNCNMEVTNFVVQDLGKEGIFTCHIGKIPFPPGRYRVSLALGSYGHIHDMIPGALSFEVESSEFFNSSRTPDALYCSCMVAHEWAQEITKR
jgi:lipopolysaccharide transport system ATP-binding protein